MSYLVLAYPTLSKPDYDWIQAIRSKEDKRYYGVVEPHFTIVFATEKLDLDTFSRHIKTKIQGTGAFNITLDSAKLVEDDSKKFFHAFLIPSQGFDVINKLHDVLYTGILSSELRHDIPFIPHVGLGTNNDRSEIERLVGDINDGNKIITGRINELYIVEYDGKKVVDLERLTLGD
ncbi:MAG: 2'-5' RNA ligase family protein [Candidatus Saccharibacteria bacterium]|nr:2'-5' RNA ligase family protein [Candidatus Saccharibacteria bacterium]